MKKIDFCTVAVAIILLVPELGWTQGGGPPQGPGGGFDPGQGGGGFRQRGGRGGFGGWGGGGFDPGQMFDRFANGKAVWTQADANSNPFGQRMFERIAQTMNITNGQITREQFTT